MSEKEQKELWMLYIQIVYDCNLTTILYNTSSRWIKMLDIFLAFASFVGIAGWAVNPQSGFTWGVVSDAFH